MTSGTKKLIGVFAAIAIVAIGLQVFFYIDEQKDIARANEIFAQQTADKQKQEQEQEQEQEQKELELKKLKEEQAKKEHQDAENTDGKEQEPTKDDTEPKDENTDTKIEPTPAPPQATPQPQAPQGPQPGDFRENNGKTETYVDGFGWLEYAPGGETEHVITGGLSGNKVGQ